MWEMWNAEAEAEDMNVDEQLSPYGQSENYQCVLLKLSHLCDRTSVSVFLMVL